MYFRCCGCNDVVQLGKTVTLATDYCGLAGKSVISGHVKSYTKSGKDMLVPVSLDNATVVRPHNDNYPLPSTDFGMVLVHGSCRVGLGSSGSTDLQVRKTIGGNIVSMNISEDGILYGHASIEDNTASAAATVNFSVSASAIASTSAIVYAPADAIAAAYTVFTPAASTPAAYVCGSAASVCASAASAKAAAAVANAAASGSASASFSISCAAADAITVTVSTTDVDSHAAANSLKKREKQNQMACKLHKRIKRAQDLKRNYQEEIKIILSKVNAYLPGSMRIDPFKKTKENQKKKQLVMEGGKDNKVKTRNYQSSKSLICVETTNHSASSTNVLENSAMVDTVTDTVPKDSMFSMKSKKPQQPSNIQRSVWHKQVRDHSKRLKELDRAPPEGCTVAHVLTQREVDEIVRHGATMIHLTNPMRDQDTGNISWTVETTGVNDGVTLLTNSAIF